MVGLTPQSELFDTQAQLNRHLGKKHHIPVIEIGETKQQALERFLREYPDARTCKECMAGHAEWTRLPPPSTDSESAESSKQRNRHG
jgi:hypothetical protein